MGQHTPFDSAGEEPRDTPSEPPEPTQSERRLRTSTDEHPSRTSRPSRPSVRPSAFGAPRPSGRPSAPPSAPPPSRVPRSVPPSSLDDEYDADTSPGLIVSALASPIHQGWNADRAASSSSFPPEVRPVSLRPSMPAVPSAAPLAPASAPVPQLQLVLARTSLPDTPSALLTPGPVTPARPDESRRAVTSIVVFAAMLCAAGVPLARYALGSDRGTQAPTTRIARSAPVTRAALETAAVGQASHPVPAQPTSPTSVDRLKDIMSTLPADAEAASRYLVDHAVRAKDSGELQLAETLLGRAFELDDHNPHPAFALAQLRFEQGNFEGAEGWVATAIRLRPRRAEYRILSAEVLERLGREGEARDERRRAKRFSE